MIIHKFKTFGNNIPEHYVGLFSNRYRINIPKEFNQPPFGNGKSTIVDVGSFQSMLPLVFAKSAITGVKKLRELINNDTNITIPYNEPHIPFGRVLNNNGIAILHPVAYRVFIDIIIEQLSIYNKISNNFDAENNIDKIIQLYINKATKTKALQWSKTSTYIALKVAEAHKFLLHKDLYNIRESSIDCPDINYIFGLSNNIFPNLVNIFIKPKLPLPDLMGTFTSSNISKRFIESVSL